MAVGRGSPMIGGFPSTPMMMISSQTQFHRTLKKKFFSEILFVTARYPLESGLGLEFEYLPLEIQDEHLYEFTTGILFSNVAENIRKIST